MIRNCRNAAPVLIFTYVSGRKLEGDGGSFDIGISVFDNYRVPLFKWAKPKRWY